MSVKKIQLDPSESAAVIHLIYVSDEEPGITRIKKGTGFAYFSPTRNVVKDSKTKKRIRSLVIPPAWDNVWICIDPRGHLQATGRDSKMRKQYRYHPKWVEFRNRTKFDKLLEFAKCLPQIRKQVAKDLRQKELTKTKVIAAVIKLLEETAIRIGNQEYAIKNKSFGLTTLKDQHVDIIGNQITFEFRGKSGIEHTINLRDKHLAKVVHACQEIPGQRLFQFYDAQEKRHPIYSQDVNNYLHEITGKEFTAKDFRTWAGTTIAITEIENHAEFATTKNTKERKQLFASVVKEVAQQLGNTPKVCRKYYIHPLVEKISTQVGMDKVKELAAKVPTSTEIKQLHTNEQLVYRLLAAHL